VVGQQIWGKIAFWNLAIGKQSISTKDFSKPLKIPALPYRIITWSVLCVNQIVNKEMHGILWRN
jgi:hypothetical protein